MFSGIQDLLLIGRQASAGNYAVDVRVVIKLLTPSMKNLYDPGCATDELFIQTKLKYGF